MFALDVLGDTVQATGLGFDKGDADRICLPIPGTLVPVPWHGEQSRRCRSAMHEHDAGRFTAIRAMCSSACSSASRRGLDARRRGRTRVLSRRPRAHGRRHAQPPASRLGAPRTPHADQLDGGPRRVHRGARPIDAAARPGRADGHGARRIRPGQFEVNLHHSPTRSLACDHAIRLKRLVKGVALQHGMDATFMAKPYRGQAGSGAHLHVSLLDRRAATSLPRRIRRQRRCSGTRSAGWRRASPTPCCLAPNANSYRRFRPKRTCR